MSIDWFRQYHGTPTDPKWRLAARRSGQPLVAVVTIVALMLDSASQASPAGTLDDWDDESAGATIDLDAASVANVRVALHGLLHDGQRIIGKHAHAFVSDAPRNAWQRLRLLVFKRDKYRCQYCGKKARRLECDHIHPRSRGGADVLDNLATACFSCNRSKGARSLSDWARSC